jgi:hypothetical protein
MTENKGMTAPLTTLQRRPTTSATDSKGVA